MHFQEEFITIAWKRWKEFNQAKGVRVIKSDFYWRANCLVTITLLTQLQLYSFFKCYQELLSLLTDDDAFMFRYMRIQKSTFYLFSSHREILVRQFSKEIYHPSIGVAVYSDVICSWHWITQFNDHKILVTHQFVMFVFVRCLQVNTWPTVDGLTENY